MAVRFSGARPMVANRFRICRRLNPASMRIRASSVSTYAQLPAEPLPKIVRRTGMADIREKKTREQYFLSARKQMGRYPVSAGGRRGQSCIVFESVLAKKVRTDPARAGT